MTHISLTHCAERALASIDDPHARDQGVALLRCAITEHFAGRFAVVSSFGADSAMLLALVAAIDRDVPVLFLDTGKHFPATLAYRDALVRRLGLRDVRDIHPDPAELARSDPHGELHRWVPDDCCALRKVVPLERALAGFDAWASGRRRQQSPTRSGLAFIESVAGRVKFNPLADWSQQRIIDELARRGLPRHPLTAEGFASIGCAPCTRAIRPGEDARAGRWDGQPKTECGIHRPAMAASGRA